MALTTFCLLLSFFTCRVVAPYYGFFFFTFANEAVQLWWVLMLSWGFNSAPLNLTRNWKVTAYVAGDLRAQSHCVQTNEKCLKKRDENQRVKRKKTYFFPLCSTSFHCVHGADLDLVDSSSTSGDMLNEIYDLFDTQTKLAVRVSTVWCRRSSLSILFNNPPVVL